MIISERHILSTTGKTCSWSVSQHRKIFARRKS